MSTDRQDVLDVQDEKPRIVRFAYWLITPSITPVHRDVLRPAVGCGRGMDWLPDRSATMTDVQGAFPNCAHGADERTCFRCHAEGPSVPLPSDWKREGMVVVADSMTGKLLGCMGRDTWQEMTPATPTEERDMARVYDMTIKVADMPEIKAWMEEAADHISSLANHDCAGGCSHVTEALEFLNGGSTND